MNTVSGILLFGYGNPGRGDDALGLRLVEAISEMHISDVECQSDMQLQVEHVIDLVGRKRIIFVDADISCAEPYAFSSLDPEKDDSYTSHAMTPEALLHAYRQVYVADAPQACLLRVRGYDFMLGDALTTRAAKNLSAAVASLSQLLTAPRDEAENSIHPVWNDMKQLLQSG